MLQCDTQAFLEGISRNYTRTLSISETKDPECLEFLQRWEGHQGAVRALAVLPDGSVVSGSDDKTLRRWDPNRGECLQVWVGHTGAVRAVVILSDGSVVSAGDDKELRHWDPDTAQCIGCWTGHTDKVTALGVTPSGSVVSVSHDKTLRHWEPSTGRTLGTWDGHIDLIKAVAVLPDGSVVTGSRDNTLRHWGLDREGCLNTWEGHEGMITALAVLPEGSIVSASTDDTLRCWDPRSGKCTNTLRSGARNVIRGFSLLPDGSLISASDKKILQRWEGPSLQEGRVYRGHEKAIFALAVLQDGSIVSGGHDMTLRRWNADSGECLQIWDGRKLAKVSSMLSSERSMKKWPMTGPLLNREQLEIVLEALKENTSITSLFFNKVGPLSEKALTALAQVVASHPQLHELTLTHCGLTDAAAELLLKALKAPTCGVKDFDLSHNPLLSKPMLSALKKVIQDRIPRLSKSQREALFSAFPMSYFSIDNMLTLVEKAVNKKKLSTEEAMSYISDIYSICLKLYGKNLNTAPLDFTLIKSLSIAYKYFTLMQEKPVLGFYAGSPMFLEDQRLKDNERPVCFRQSNVDPNSLYCALQGATGEFSTFEVSVYEMGSLKTEFRALQGFLKKAHKGAPLPKDFDPILWQMTMKIPGELLNSQELIHRIAVYFRRGVICLQLSLEQEKNERNRLQNSQHLARYVQVLCELKVLTPEEKERGPDEIMLILLNQEKKCAHSYGQSTWYLSRCIRRYEEKIDSDPRVTIVSKGADQDVSKDTLRLRKPSNNVPSATPAATFYTKEASTKSWFSSFFFSNTSSETDEAPLLEGSKKTFSS